MDFYQENNYTPLHIACRYGNLEDVKKLIKSGADLEAQYYFIMIMIKKMR